MCLRVQDSLEEVFDVLLANQRALLAERHAQRRFLVQSFQNLQAVINDTFSCIRYILHTLTDSSTYFHLHFIIILFTTPYYMI